MCISASIAEIMRALGLLSWGSLWVGSERGWANRHDLIGYAVQWLVDHPNETDQSVLLIAGGENYDDARLRQLLSDYLERNGLLSPETAALELDKWRLARLLDLDKTDLEPEEKLERLQEIYAEFGFPNDMAACSRYFFSSEERASGIRVGDSSQSPLDAMKEVISHLKHKLKSS
jgi:hypothetical protein